MVGVPETVRLPNGHTLTVTQVFGGFSFKTNELDLHHSPFPPGWTVVLDTEDEDRERELRLLRRYSEVQPLHPDKENEVEKAPRHQHHTTHRFTKPTLQRDGLYLSSISIPASNDFQAPKSPTRQLAMMLWATLFWYFHKEEPDPHVETEASALTPDSGKPKGDWRVKVKREGIFQGKNVLPKFERMGLITSENSYVGVDTDPRYAGYNHMFVSRRAFWQIDPRIFLFSLPPAAGSPHPSTSPRSSRPSSPARSDGKISPRPDLASAHDGSSPPGPWASGSNLPTYFPPSPLQYVFTNHIRHPIRPKPPRQGEVFYTRWISSVGQWLSFRVPSLSPDACRPSGIYVPGHAGGSMPTVPTISSIANGLSDVEFLHKWMNDPRVNAAWGCAGPRETQEKVLIDALSSKHSFPVFGCWNDKPFGYFEIYWVKEDMLGKLLGGDVGNFTRGLHVLVGEQEFRGSHRVKLWLTALVHYCWLADMRTETVMLEPRVDNQKFIGYLQESGFYKSGEITFPHKQAAVMKIQRDAWEGPDL